MNIENYDFDEDRDDIHGCLPWIFTILAILALLLFIKK